MRMYRFVAVAFDIVITAVWLGCPSRAAEVIPADAEWRYFKGTAEASSPDTTAWRQAGFDDSSWASGQAAFFYEHDPASGTAYTGHTELADMFGGYTCVFLRKTFVLGDPSNISQLDLTAESDDGFIAWINGQEVARFHMPDGNIAFDGTSLSALGEPIPPVTYTDTNPRRYLVAGVNVLAVQAFNSSRGNSSDFVFNASLSAAVDAVPPVVTELIPAAGTAVRALNSVEVHFSEAVQGVDPGDLLINGLPATNVLDFAPDVFLFEFAQPPAGTVQVTWAPAPDITDQANPPNTFAPPPAWTYTLNPNLPVPGVMISEFMADNDETLNDEDGDSSDWIELYNPTADTANLNGWYLTDSTNNLTKWRFPNVGLPAKGYLVVFASGKNRVNPTGRLHTNFKLENDAGGYLALVDAGGQVVSEFKAYPQQHDDIAYGRDRLDPSLVGYFPQPTPGSANAVGGPGFAPDVDFSVKGGCFSTPFELTLTAAQPAALIYYTLDGSAPTNTSTLYTGPISVTNSVQVRARAFVPGLLPGEPRSESYLQLGPTALTYTTDLPILVIHTFGKSSIPADGDIFAQIDVFQPRNGVTSLTNAPDVRTRSGINLRGSSTLGYPKPSLAVELRNEFDDDKNVSLLGMPAESDWVLYAPNNFEPILIHNPFAHQLSRNIGRYSPRTRFVVVYLKRTKGAISYPADYFGIYALEEKIKRGPDRVDVPALEPEHTTPPKVTGGYLIKIDRQGPGESGLWAGGAYAIVTYPRAEDWNLPQRRPQVNYLQSYLDAFGNALNGPNFTNPQTGYAAYIDVDSWIDHHLLNIITFNVDALRLSAYFYKQRSDKLYFGPLWDFDRSLNSTDGRDANPRTWRSAVGDRGTDFFRYDTQAWWGRLFEDLDFWQRWIDRWQELRENEFALTNLNALVDSQTSEVRKEQPREQSRWYVTPRGGFQGEINSLKIWLSNRVDFIDTNFVRKPTLSLPAGNVAPGTELTLSGPAGATIYYSLDGTDPRVPGGGLSPAARPYSQPITVTANARLVARARDLNHFNLTNRIAGDGKPPLSSPWSGPAAATYVVKTPPLAITEIMYHPAPPPAGDTNDVENFAFVEVKNVGTNPLNLVGFDFTNGIHYTFTATSGVTRLAPNAYALLVKNKAAFLTRYPGVTNIAGEYEGSLDNGGERLCLAGPLKEPVADFAYDNDWYPASDGLGFSLVLTDESLPASAWANAAAWRRSSQPGGSPGTADPALVDVPAVLVNEALTHTDPPQVDAVELFNPGVSPVNLGGWFLSDDFNEPRKFRIPDPTLVPADGFVVFDETQFNAGGPASFSFSSLGDEVYLCSGDGTNLTGYVHGFHFGAAANGVTFGRLVDSLGREHFVAQVQPTLGAANAGPRIGPVAINEIMYRPPPLGTVNDTLNEFIELRNVAGQAAPLFDPAHVTNTWRIDGGVSFQFPTNVTLPANGFALVVNFDPSRDFGQLDAFRAKYAVPAGVPIFGPYRGNLDNAGDRVALYQPDSPQTETDPSPGSVPYVLVEDVHYGPAAPWPAAADGTGKSLQRLASTPFADDPASWQAAEPTAGQPNVGDINLDWDGDGLPNDWEAAHQLDPHDATGDNGAAGDPDQDGLTNLEEYLAGTDPQLAASRLAISAVDLNDAETLIRFAAVAGKTYTVVFTDSLAAGAWQRLADVAAQPATGEVTVRDPGRQTTRFYRLVTPRMP